MNTGLLRCHTDEVGVRRRLTVMTGMTVLLPAMTACIAPDVDVVGALGVTVDEDQRPVVVVEACDGAVAELDLFLDREGLAEDEENELVNAWVPQAPVPGSSELVLHAPTGAWEGQPVDVAGDRGYIVTAVGEGESEVLTQVTFRGVDLAGMEPGTVYRSDADPDVRELVGSSAEDFTATVCSR